LVDLRGLEPLTSTMRM